MVHRSTTRKGIEDEAREAVERKEEGLEHGVTVPKGPAVVAKEVVG